MVILDTIRTFLTENRIAGPVIVAVSGGVDSTALLVAFAQLRAVPFEAAHVNHHLRGADSDADEAFVRDLCARYGITLHVMDGNLDPEEIRRRGIESAARKIRYEKLKELGGIIATAHQKNDQAETVLMRMVTGGPLRGIQPIRADGVVRPLLTVTRLDIEQFLAARGIGARTDRSNEDPRFLRNRVRKLLGDRTDLAAVADVAREQWHDLQKAIDAADDSTMTGGETRMRLPEDPWMRRALLHRHITRMDPDARLSSKDLERLARATKRTSVTKALELIPNGDRMVIRRYAQAIDPFEHTINPGESVDTPMGVLHLEKANERMNESANQRIQLPEGAAQQFTVRNRRNGDRFQPLGMSKSKKLKDFLIDRKIPAARRNALPLLLWGEQIVWVAGVEISEAFKVRGGAGELYEVSVEKKEDQESV